MERKRKRDSSTGRITPEIKSFERESSRRAPKCRTPIDRCKSDIPGQNTSPSRSSPRRRSATSTPESVTKRELKKLEDYWTRNEPVTEDSPRLRSNRKVNFNIKDFLRESPRSSRSPKTEILSSKESKRAINLPESPIPNKQKVSDKIIVNYAVLDSGDLNLKPNPRIKLKDCGTDIGLSLSPTLNLNSDITKVTKCDTEISNLAISNLDVQETVTDLAQDTSSDSDDDDYIPPRKKLRSEVKEEELWDGIPLTVSFKRLAPIAKIPEDVQEGYSQIKSKKPSKIDNEGNEKSEKQLTDISDNNEIGLKKKPECKQRHQNITPKRSNRLKEKALGTPEKIDNTAEKFVRTCQKEMDKSYGSAIHVDTPKVSVSEGFPELFDRLPLISTYAPHNEMTSSTSSDNVLKLTLSQILTVDSKRTDTTDAVQTSENISADYSTDEVESDVPGTSNAINSISRTINDIFNDINVENEQFKGVTDKPVKTSNEDNIAGNDVQVTRRSRRLSDLEKRKSNQPSPEKTPIADKESKTNQMTEVQQESSLLENELKLLEQDTLGGNWIAEQSTSKHKLFTKCADKNTAKTVPPLRIKLKQPFQLGSKLNNTAETKKISEDKHDKNNTPKANKSKKKTKKERLEQSSIDASIDEEALPGSSQELDIEEEKKSSTPKSQKKNTPKPRRCRSPPPTDSIALRLNNDRRLSAAGNLLTNPVLNKHACVLWSSENRRHMQLSNPKSSLSELDAKLSLKWDRLCDKEKLKYFQRARDAIRDENRHSSKRHDALENDRLKQDAPAKFANESSMDNFLKLSAASQMTEVKKWLNFYHELSPQTCTEVISSFKEALTEENSNKKKEADQEKSKSKSKKSKQKRKQEKMDSTDNNATYRKIMFGKILEKKDYILGMLLEKKRSQQRMVLEAYCGMLRRLICGEVVDFYGDVRSDKLTETLCDVKALEKASRLAVTGTSMGGVDYDNILARLHSKTSPNGKEMTFALDDSDVNDRHIEHICQQIQCLPSLSPKTIEDHLPEVVPSDTVQPDVTSSPPRLGRGRSAVSPVTVLTEWVAEDLLACQPQIGFRKAISLLSNKVVPSPTIILPPKAGSFSTSSANKNQNCNIVFTKLQKTKPPVVSAKINAPK